MSDTPRTDAARLWTEDTHTVEGIGLEIVDANFARQLERELAEARADKDRMDWLEAHNKGTFGIWPDGQDGSWTITGEPTDSYSGGIPLGDGSTLRSAIDAARK